MCQNSITPTPILLKFGTYHESGSQILCVKYEHSIVNADRGLYNFGTSVPLEVVYKKALKSLFINEEAFKRFFFCSELAAESFSICNCKLFQ